MDAEDLTEALTRVGVEIESPRPEVDGRAQGLAFRQGADC